MKLIAEIYVPFNFKSLFIKVTAGLETLLFCSKQAGSEEFKKILIFKHIKRLKVQKLLNESYIISFLIEP
jgi:hypothetical protein